MNKASLGLHAWGNIVPCCQKCNNDKQQKNWVEFLGIKANGTIYQKRKKLIDTFVQSKNYDPKLDLHKFADSLYEDVGEVAMTLIKLRYKQAEEAISKILGK